MKPRLPRHLLLKAKRRARLTPDDHMTARLDAFHEALPQISKRKLGFIARKDPRILEISASTFRTNVQRTSNLLGVGLAGFALLAAHQPSLIYKRPWNLRLKARALARAFNVRFKDILPVLRKAPALLSRDEASLIVNINALATTLGVPPDAILKMALKHPSILNVTPKTIQENLQSAAHLLNIPLAVYVRAAISQPQLTYQSPQTILGNTVSSARQIGIKHTAYLAIVLRSPSLFCRTSASLERKARLIRCLIHYTRDERTLQQILERQPAALTYAPERLIARCLIARYRLSTARATTLVVLPNKKATDLLVAHLKSRYGKAGYPIVRRWKAIGLLHT